MFPVAELVGLTLELFGIAGAGVLSILWLGQWVRS